MLTKLELAQILLKYQIPVSIKTFLVLYNSLVDNNFCIYVPNQKTKNFKVFYDKNFLKKELQLLKGLQKKWMQQGIHSLDFENADYPKQFLDLKQPPLCLFYSGQINWKQENLAIVGKREPRTYSLEWMETQLQPFLEKTKVTVISGGARGVDSKAHQIALLNDQKTLYMMPSGLLNLYPHHLNSKRQDLEHLGASFMSAYLPETEMRKQNFSSRNQLIAALSKTCLIIEAEIRSGTYNTAKFCIDQNKALGVVPSFPKDKTYSGSLQLIYDGAQMIRDQLDLKVLFESS